MNVSSSGTILMCPATAARIRASRRELWGGIMAVGFVSFSATVLVGEMAARVGGGWAL